MKPILVHCHIYYPDLYQELKQCILNIKPHSFDLFVTLVEDHKSIIEDIKSTFPEAQIEILENRGYDIAPFIHLLNKVDLDKYSYVVKLHTKRDMPLGSMLNYFDVSGNKWRKYALDFVSAPDKFKHCLEAFEKDNNLGMISNYHLILNDEKYDLEARRKTEKLLVQLGLTNTIYGFVSGTIFMTRASLLKPLKNLKLSITDFDVPDKNHSSNFAHTIERLIGCLVLNQGQKIADVLTLRQYSGKISYFLRRLRCFVFRRKITKSGNLSVKICKIPLPVKFFKKG